VGHHNDRSGTGLHFISLEGNTMLGDQGAIAIANIIRTPSNNTKCLSKVNLAETGMTFVGYEELRNALT
jgi:hypothetical protein